jgi:deazaflavin-dependent oxidoreductase (nitroreductase family)
MGGDRSRGTELPLASDLPASSEWYAQPRAGMLSRRAAGPAHLAGRCAAGLGVVIHRGRRSGRLYETPVSVFAAKDGYVFALIYGPDTDWVKNVLAAGGCELRTRGHATRLTSPRLYHDESRRGIRPMERQVLRLIGVADFLCLQTVPAGAPATGQS